MKFWMIVIILCPLIVFASENDSCGQSAQYAQQFDLEINKCANVSNDLQIRFLRVAEDSRCPANAQCIWAGNAKIILAVQAKNSSQKEIELNTMDQSDKSSAKIENSNNWIRLVNLTASQNSENNGSQDPYIATLLVEKKK